MVFHELRFPTTISLGAATGPERRTEIVTLASGYEERNSRWADSRRRFNAGYGVKTLDDLHQVIDFFEERRGRLYGFRWKDLADHKSCAPSQTPAASDQLIATADGTAGPFQLIKTYGGSYAPYARPIKKPVSGTVLVAVNNVTKTEGVDYVLDPVRGEITFHTGFEPASGALITAGYEFDTPVRFDTDRLEINLSHFNAGQIPDIPLIEILV